MSALTKIFVVLHVVVSLLLAAAVVVFVNRTENWKTVAETNKQMQLLAESQAAAKNEEILAVRSDNVKLATEMTAQINTLKTQINTGEQKVADLQTQLAQKEQAIAQAASTNTSIALALSVAQSDVKAQREAYSAQLAEKDKIEKQNAEDENKITELTNANDVLARQSRYVQEQIAQLQQQNDQLNKILRQYNISPTGNTLPAGGAINATPSVNINGIVRDFKNINGVPFATISLGSADAVTHGMKFNVIDPTKKQFLGYLTVDTVGVHEATGRLDGPAVNQIRANVSEVRTQL